MSVEPNVDGVPGGQTRPGSVDSSEQSLTPEEIAEYRMIKSVSPGWTADQIIDVAREGIRVRREKEDAEREARMKEEEEKMWAEKENEEVSKEPVTRDEVNKLLSEERARAQAEVEHASCLAKLGFTDEAAYLARKAVEGALSDPANKGYSIADCYAVVAKNMGMASAEATPSANDSVASDSATQEKIRNSSKVTNASPPGATGSGDPSFVGSDSDDWDDETKPGWDLFSPARQERYKREFPMVDSSAI